MQNETLQKIRDFADRAHGSQLRKYTQEPYIEHPVRVMKLSSQFVDKQSLKAAALLHDVLEDTETTADEILSFLISLMDKRKAQQALQLVRELTDVYEKKNYPDWNRRKRKEMEARRLAKVSADAQTIKYADIIDNSREIMQHDPGFGIRFSKECKMILEHMKDGHPELRQMALEVVEGNLTGVQQNP